MFSPTPLSINVGQSVTWTNNDQILHTATSGAPGSTTPIFDGQMDGQGKTFRFTFTSPGRYPYFCSRHNGMLGEIVVGS
jgi:plastocyanin